MAKTHVHITQAVVAIVVAMDSCFALIRAHLHGRGFTRVRVCHLLEA